MAATDPTQDKDDKTVPVTLLLTEKDLQLTVGARTFDPHPHRPGCQGPHRPHPALEQFKDVKEKLPDQTAITVQTEDAVRYEDLVHIIDECIGAEASPPSPSSPR